MQDNYSHLENNVYYIVENIMGPVEKSLEYEQLTCDFHSQLENYCNCDTICSLSTCNCIEKSCGENYIAYWQDGMYKHKLKKEHHPIFECNEKCSCGFDCNNRIVQRGPAKGLEIRYNEKGLGLYATCFIAKGTFICEYAGELITKSQATIRHRKNMTDGKMNYIFCLREHFGERVVETFVDPSVFGNIGRYLNHSCQPNCFIVPVRCDSPVPKLAIFTLCNVFKNEELTFHYGASDVDSQSEQTRVQCLCKSENCNGFMPFYNY